MPRQALLRDYSRLVAWARQPGCPISGLSLHDDGRLDLTLCYAEDDAERRCRLTAQLNAERYPTAGAQLREEGATGGSIGDTLDLVNASLSDGAPLSALVETLAATIGVDVDGLEEALAAQPGDAAADATEDEVEDDANDYAINQGADTDRALLDLQRRWQHRVAREDREAMEGEAGTDRGKLAVPVALREMFSSSKSSKILVTELLQLVRDNMIGLHDFRVTAVNDCVHHWHVTIADVMRASRLGKSMAAHDASAAKPCHIELELGFTRGLHPTYPPWLRLASPRLAGHVGQAVMACSLFTIEGWDPLKPSKAVVRQAQALLEAHGELAYPRADAPGGEAGGFGAYTRAEHICCRLEALACAELRPRWALTAEGAQLHRVVNAVADDERERLRGFRSAGKETCARASAARAQVAWAAGTGYGYGKIGTPTWDARASELAQRQRDSEVRALLDELTDFARRGELRAAVVSPSCLLPLLRLHLRGASMNDMRSRVDFFASLLRLLNAMAGEAELRPLLYQTAAAPEHEAAEAAEAAAAAAAAEAVAEATAEAAARAAAPPERGRSAPVALRSAKRLRVSAPVEPAACAGASSSQVPAQPAAPPLPRTAVTMAGSVVEALSYAARMADVFARMHKSHAALAATDDHAAGSRRDAPSSREGPDAQSPSVTRSQHDPPTVSVSLAATLAAAASGVPAGTGARSAEGASTGDGESKSEGSDLRALLEVASAIVETRSLLSSPSAPRAHSPDPAAVNSSARRRAQASAARTSRSGAKAAAAPAEPVAHRPVAHSSERVNALPLSADEMGELARAYEDALRPMLFDETGAFETHRYLKESANGGARARRAKRIMVEAPDLGASLPLSLSSSVCVRIDASRMHLWKALITGPDDTPYANGCFVFDLFLPPDYPNTPPKVLLTTTGGGAVRFNPNLYADGKVCLSLLGTWTGDVGESWHAETSTVLQVLMSIQALILVAKPYFNEPGYEQEAGSERASKLYNQRVREATLRHAMTGQLRNPPAEFADAVRAHFRLKQRQIRHQCARWLADAAGDAQHKSVLASLTADLEAELRKLK